MDKRCRDCCHYDQKYDDWGWCDRCLFYFHGIKNMDGPIRPRAEVHRHWYCELFERSAVAPQPKPMPLLEGEVIGPNGEERIIKCINWMLDNWPEKED